MSPAVPDTPITRDVLREIGLFGGMSDEALDEVTRLCKTRTVGPGDLVFREGDLPQELFVLLDGEMEVLKKSKRGRDTRVAILGPKDCFGEMGFVDMQPRSATVRALGPSRLLCLSGEALAAIYRNDPKSYTMIVLNIARDLSRRLRVTDALLADISANLLDEFVHARRSRTT